MVRRVAQVLANGYGSTKNCNKSNFPCFNVNLYERPKRLARDIIRTCRIACSMLFVLSCHAEQTYFRYKAGNLDGLDFDLKQLPSLSVLTASRTA